MANPAPRRRAPAAAFPTHQVASRRARVYTREVNRSLSLPLLALLILLLPQPAQAYVGPGAGFAFVTSFFLLLSTTALVLLALLSWPLRLLVRLVFSRRPPGKPRLDRLVVVGLDGLDPRRLRQLMEQQRLPNFSRLAQRGSLGQLGTTCPAISPVAWSTFATGVDPSRHGIFDFLAPDRRTMRPRLSSAEVLPPRRVLRLGPWQLPLGSGRVRNLRRAVPFWHMLGDHGVDSCILRVPISYPPERFRGTLLSAMCAPDLLGTQGSFTYFTSEPEAADEQDRVGGRVVQVERERGNGDDSWRVRTRLSGPPNPLRRDGCQLSLPLSLELDAGTSSALLRVGRKRVKLQRDQYSDWVELPFAMAPGLTLKGVARFLLRSVDPLRLYVTPLNIHPAHPSQPISHPAFFSVFLGKLLGPFATLGLAEDTWALNEGVIDDAGFLQQVQLIQQEREQMLLQMLKRTRRGVLACVFDATDRVQHMFMDQPEGTPGADAVEAVYQQMDELLGRLLEQIDLDDPRQQLLVLSDHGFAPFTRGVNLNAWLQEQGYLTYDDGPAGEFLAGVDWPRTRAYAMGLSGIYLNLKGREAQGAVAPADAEELRTEIADKLAALRDGDRPGVPIRKVFDSHRIFSGPFMDDAPDLIVGYSRGYRASWDTARGMRGEQVIEDNTRHWRGDHCMDPREVPGVLLSSQRLDQQGAHMRDIAPTVLELFGIPKPAHMQGRSLLNKEPGNKELGTRN